MQQNIKNLHGRQQKITNLKQTFISNYPCYWTSYVHAPPPEVINKKELKQGQIQNGNIAKKRMQKPTNIQMLIQTVRLEHYPLQRLGGIY